MGKNQFVVRVGEKWGVRGAGNERLTQITDTQEQAIEIAKKIAQNQGSEVVVQDRHGRFRSKDSFGNDPCPPKDTEH